MGLVEFTVFKFGFCCSWQKKETRGSLFEHLSIRSKSCPTNRWQEQNVKIKKKKSRKKDWKIFAITDLVRVESERSLFTKILWRRHAYKVKRAIPWPVIVPLRPSPLGAPWTLTTARTQTLDAADEWTLCFFSRLKLINIGVYVLCSQMCCFFFELLQCLSVDFICNIICSVCSGKKHAGKKKCPKCNRTEPKFWLHALKNYHVDNDHRKKRR